ncbi:Lsr2 family protein [Amnibacterium flavum]|uniref:Lsr2 family protein n=1 Tax=Amnibacterium flavum TaxID=2173173 RepID=A0A2V1HXI7_9MICO|nr:Lsr2 family protein [Amnibacterium flavum]PVZ95034.1 Lsr2 family protein [Amnibacterium flavum]
MAQKVTVQIVDDLDGTPITDGSGGTVAFSLEGKSYEIDLSADNTDKLYSALEPFIDKARSIGGSARRRTTTAAPSASRDRLQEIREWAKANGHNVATRGRISRDIQEAYARARG